MKQAVILAAGEGKRLRPFTVTKPKVMLHIAGKPILQYVVESLAENGIRNIVLVVGYKKEQVFDYMGSGERFGVDITYSIQESQLGTAHALAQVKKLIEDEFLVLPGDKLIEANTISQFVAIKHDALLVKRVDNPERYGVVTIDNGMVKEIVEKPREAKTNTVNTGIYIFSPKIFDYIGNQLDIPDVLNIMLARSQPISAQETEATWLDIVYPWDILSLNDVTTRQISPSLGGTIETSVLINGPVSIGKDTVIRSNSYIVGPVVIGNNCDIGPNVCVLPATSIGNNVVIAAFSEIKNSVIGNDVNIGTSCTIQDSVIDMGCVIKGHFSAFSGQAEVKVNNEYHTVNIGAMLGENCSIENNIVAQAGVILGNYSQVQAMKLIKGNFPDRSMVF